MIRKQLPENLFNENPFYSLKDRIYYLTKNIDNYYCHVFCLKLTNIIELQNYWKICNSIVAANFQSQLSNEIERWNIYIIFLVNDNISREVRYEIEQDKYSSRKIIFDFNVFREIQNDDDKLINIIEKKLFIFKSAVNEKIEQSSSENIIGNIDSQLLNTLKEYSTGNKIEQFYDNYFNLKYGK